MSYEQDLEKDLKAARKRLDKSMAAKSFMNSKEGAVIQDWINERVSYLLNKMTAKTPLTDREYLSYHGAIRELQDFNVMLQGQAASESSAAEEVKALDEQFKAVSGQESIKF